MNTKRIIWIRIIFVLLSALLCFCIVADSHKSFTGYSEYDSLINSVLAVRNGTLEYDPSLFNYDVITNHSGWILKDIDNNGQPELIFGVNWERDSSTIFNIYTLHNGLCVQLVDGWNRNRFYICDDIIINAWDNSNFEYGYNYYRYNNVTLKLYQSISYLGYPHKGTTHEWYYSTESDSGKVLIGRGTSNYQINPLFIPISEKEADSLIESYNYELFTWKPFKEQRP